MILSSAIPIIKFTDVTHKNVYFAFKVPVEKEGIPLGASLISAKFIYVPFRYLTEVEVKNKRKLCDIFKLNKSDKVYFIMEDRFLIGTDILRNFQLHLFFEQRLSIGNLEIQDKFTQKLSLERHGFSIPGVIVDEYKLKRPVEIVDELLLLETDIGNEHELDTRSKYKVFDFIDTVDGNNENRVLYARTPNPRIKRYKDKDGKIYYNHGGSVEKEEDGDLFWEDKQDI